MRITIDACQEYDCILFWVQYDSIYSNW
jgi:hypothetical protein